MNDSVLLSCQEVAARLSVSARTLRRWVAAGEFPPATTVLPGGHLRWRLAAVDEWVASRDVAAGGGVKEKIGNPRPDTDGQVRS